MYISFAIGAKIKCIGFSLIDRAEHVGLSLGQAVLTAKIFRDVLNPLIGVV